MTERRRATQRDPEKHSGDETFAGSRVPVSFLGQILLAGGSTSEFLAAFPSVEPWQVDAVIRERLPHEQRPRDSLIPEELADARQPFFPPSVYVVEMHYGLLLEAFLSFESAAAEPGVPPLSDTEWTFLFDLSGEAIWVHEPSGTRIYEMPIIDDVGGHANSERLNAEAGDVLDLSGEKDRARIDTAQERLNVQAADVFDILGSSSAAAFPRKLEQYAPTYDLDAVHRLARLAAEVKRMLTADELDANASLRGLLREVEDFVEQTVGAFSFDEAIRFIEGSHPGEEAERVQAFSKAGGGEDVGYVYGSLAEMVVRELFTPDEAAALSNTICGSEAAAQALEKRGLLVIDSVEEKRGERVAFFRLTERGNEYLLRYFNVPFDD